MSSSGSKDTIILERRFVPEGTLVMRQGEEGYSAYLIQSGSVGIYSEQDGRKVELARLQAGQIFGEMALIFDEPRTASVKALEDCNLIVINRDVFQHKLARTDPTIRAMIEMLTRRVIQSNNNLIKQKSGVEDLQETVQLVYQNVLSALPAAERAVFQKSVMPPLESFMAALQNFQKSRSKA